MSDVIIYQMGKVASSAIQEALKSAGLQSAHAHFLGDRALSGIVKSLTGLSPTLSSTEPGSSF